ncbi:IS1182 family transposase [Pseudochryseolinea flava]|uniref:IS1182 family transposase n=2 Tax=Pseudochryseolinea flava TaxID=2059302 RepID=A0A364XV53_9BACT|nr:IS1182 family transposase [Pseudochryseolinea flava]
MMLPPSLEELIDKNHPVRIVNQVIDKINIDPLLKKFKGGGTSSYHPRMLLKVLIYGYLNNTYSSRRLESALKENIHFMWLSGMNKPDHNSINRFRSERLKDVLKVVFGQVVELLVEAGHINLKEIFTDGTKLEAQANRYTFVWGNAIKSNKAKMAEQLNELWSYAEKVAWEELKDQKPETFAPINSNQVSEVIEKIDKALEGKKVSNDKKQKLNYAKKHWPAAMERYAEHEKLLGNRNSYSKTDPDATFMRMKEDHMKNGQLKPAYNIQLSSQDQFIVNYSLHQNTTDTSTLKSHLKSFHNLYGHYPEVLVADAGYGSEENYDLLAKRKVSAYVKHNQFDREQRNKLTDWFKSENLEYDKKNDQVYCPIGEPMKYIGEATRITANGFKQTYHKYQASKCKGCPVRDVCHSQKGNRIVDINHRLRKLKSQANERLTSEVGISYRKKRAADIEPVFGNIKHNKNFKRFMLRGLRKVEIETGLLAIAHNLAKATA